MDTKVPQVSGGPEATESSRRDLCRHPHPHPRRPSSRTPRQWEEREAASGGLLSPAAARPRPPPGREDPPSAPAGRGRGRVIFTSLQAAGATGSERAARQMWRARQLGAATAGLAAGRGRGGGGGRGMRRRADPRPQVPPLFPAALTSRPRSPLTPHPLPNPRPAQLGGGLAVPHLCAGAFGAHRLSGPAGAGDAAAPQRGDPRVPAE